MIFSSKTENYGFRTGNPSITFFKVVYRRHTQFAMESIEQVFNGTPAFGKKCSATVSRNGDLISTVFLEVTLKKSAGASFFPGEALLKEVELEINSPVSNSWLPCTLRTARVWENSGSVRPHAKRMWNITS